MWQLGATPLDGSRAGAKLHLAHVHVISLPMSIDAIPIFDEALDAQERTAHTDASETPARQLAGVSDASINLIVPSETLPGYSIRLVEAQPLVSMLGAYGGTPHVPIPTVLPTPAA